MRRKEFAVQEWQEIEQFLNEMSFGFLAMCGEDGWPHVKPLNFVYWKDTIYVHGSRVGEKITDLKRSPNVTFSVAKEYALIPSYFSDPTFACPATSYFKSVSIRGTAELVDDLEQKAEALEAFMQKLQPEGGYAPITADNPEYASRLRGVAVIGIRIDSLSAKFKFGQNLKEPARANLTSRIAERGLPLDEETVRLMELYCPHARKDSSS
ncbi:hypothetical protein J31TS4_22670 [Paenibacillus sp. J31TS4]|uniref:pyridoxamine 5'-phosphate oxidase family protein n=1 Tax=Paenibacillus sp. J31TS4 TaxID=2807195 RepID=UPI001B0B0AD7|nr:pyridoxamine 5'-phosphate oxidase family protein [Paenibacillus sp. J31TS4]GIP38987.1 hypothetical protein J31TS4_22670 [Paenibacillus sp. J31TS4]